MNRYIKPNLSAKVKYFLCQTYFPMNFRNHSTKKMLQFQSSIDKMFYLGLFLKPFINFSMMFRKFFTFFATGFCFSIQKHTFMLSYTILKQNIDKTKEGFIVSTLKFHIVSVYGTLSVYFYFFHTFYIFLHLLNK